MKMLAECYRCHRTRYADRMELVDLVSGLWRCHARTTCEVQRRAMSHQGVTSRTEGKAKRSSRTEGKANE